jgi:hypothetical protein
VFAIKAGVDALRQSAAQATARAAELDAQLKVKDTDTAKQMARLLADLESLRSSKALMEQLIAEQKTVRAASIF